MSGWLARHLQALLFALGRLARQPLASFFTLLVIALALALPTTLALVADNAAEATGKLANAIDVTVYFKSDVPLDKVRQLAQSAAARTGVASASVLPADEALQEFRDYSGFGVALDALQSNPLPHVLNVRPSPDAASPAQMENLRSYLAAWPEVDLVQVDSDWVRRLDAILGLLRRVVAGTGLLLGLGVLAVIGNTIRLEILNRRAEIEVTKLVGGTNRFVRRPFLYTGVLFGAGGALLAFAIVSAAALALAEPVARLAGSYGSAFSVAGPAWKELGVLVGVGALLGWLGAWLAATRQLRRIEPRA